MPTFAARRHRYADGKNYNPNRYTLTATEGGRSVSVGGVLVLGDKTIAYAGHPEICNSVSEIVKRSTSYVWGSTLSEALSKIKPALENEL